jgi:hypothetical protein
MNQDNYGYTSIKNTDMSLMYSMQYSTLRSTHIKFNTTSTEWNIFGMEMKITLGGKEEGGKKTQPNNNTHTIVLKIIASMIMYILSHHKQINSKHMMPYNLRHKHSLRNEK